MAYVRRAEEVQDYTTMGYILTDKPYPESNQKIQDYKNMFGVLPYGMTYAEVSNALRKGTHRELYGSDEQIEARRVDTIDDAGLWREMQSGDRELIEARPEYQTATPFEFADEMLQSIFSRQNVSDETITSELSQLYPAPIEETEQTEQGGFVSSILGMIPGIATKLKEGWSVSSIPVIQNF